MRNFERILAVASTLAGQPDAASQVRRWRAAALKDEGGVALDKELATQPLKIDSTIARQQA